MNGPGLRSARLASSALTLAATLAPALFAPTITGCRDVDRWASGSGRYEGTVVAAQFVRSGIASGTRLCLSLDTARIDDAPGSLTSSDGRFSKTPLVPIREVHHDPLSTMSFGAGRTKNLLFGARQRDEVDAGGGESDLLVIVSLMDTGSVEVRLLRPTAARAGDAGTGVFAVFPLDRFEGACSF